MIEVNPDLPSGWSSHSRYVCLPVLPALKWRMVMISTMFGVLTTSFSLLWSDLFADVEVTAGSKTWKLHCAILVSRSTWFRKALTGNWVVRIISQSSLG